MGGLVESTIYRVETVYDVTDRASRTLGSIERNAESAARGMNRLTGAVAGTITAFLGAKGFGAAKSALIDFNSGVENTKNQIAGMMALATKTDLNDNLARADRLFENLQRRARTLPGTTQEYATMAGMITQPIMDAGLRMKDLENLTVSTVVGAKALRVEAGAAARDIDQALRGQYHSVDVFTGKLLGAQGYSGEGGRQKFNALSAQKRAEELMKAVNAPQIQQLAAAQGATFSGALSTFQDTAQQFFGKVGLPLFRELTKEIKSWNEWLEKNQYKVDQIAKSVASGLVTGFRVVKDAVMFIADHADTLITIGKIWAAVKIGGMLGGALGGGINSGSSAAGSLLGAFRPGGFFRGPTDRFNPETGGYEFTPAGRGMRAVGGLKGFAENAPMLGQIAATSYALTTVLMHETGMRKALTAAIDPQRAKLEQITQTMQRFDEEIAKTTQLLEKENGARGTQTSANMTWASQHLEQQLNVLNDIQAGRYEGAGTMFWKEGQRKLLEQVDLDPEQYLGSAQTRTAGIARLQTQLLGVNQRMAIGGVTTDATVALAMSQMTKDQQESVDVQKATQRIMEENTRLLFEGKAMLGLEAALAILKGENSLDSFRSQAKPSVTNIKIDRVEVSAKDPDRWIAELDAKAKKHVAAPRQPRSAIPGGR